MRYFDEYGNSLKKNKKESAMTGHRNYTVEDTFFGGCEFKGKRPTQEDRMVAYAFEPIEAEILQKLTPNQRTYLLQETFALLQEGLDQIPENGEQGSTAAVAVVSPNDNHYLMTGSLGDATIFEVVFTNDSLQPCIKRLNSLHNPSEPAEFKRIIDAQGMIVRGRVGGVFAVSRAFGDNDYVALGISHEPEVKTFTNDNLEEKRVFLIIACDGLTEPKTFKEPEIGNLFGRCKDYFPRQIAEELAKEALNQGSYDNISVQVCEIKKNSAPFLLAVFDGHGGAEVSEFLRCNFVSVFQHCLLKMELGLRPDSKGSTSNAFSLPQIDKKSKSCLMQYALQRIYSEPSIDFNQISNEERNPSKPELRRLSL